MNGADLFFFSFTFRLVVKQRTPSFIILSKESSFRASFLQRYQVERWQKIRTLSYFTWLYLEKNRARIRQVLVKIPKSFRFSLSNQNIARDLTSTPKVIRRQFSAMRLRHHVAKQLLFREPWTRLILKQAVKFRDEQRMVKRGKQSSRYDIQSLCRVSLISEYLDLWEKLRICDVSKTIHTMRRFICIFHKLMLFILLSFCSLNIF